MAPGSAVAPSYGARVSSSVASPLQPVTSSAGDEPLRWLLLGFAACLYLPLIFAGPGSDPDSLRELRSGTTLLWQHRYVLSRPPGYFPYEAVSGVLYALGGAVATNFATLTMSLVLLDSFMRVCAHFEVPHRYLLTAAMMIHPVYWATSASTIDFIPALGCFFLGFRLWLDGRYLVAAALLGSAVGIRLSSIFLAGPLLIWEVIARPRDLKLWAGALLATAVGVALYVPEFVASGNSLDFLTYYLAAWSVTDRLGRFIYKNVYFWGVPATIFLIALTPIIIRELAGCDRKFSRIVALSLSVMITFEALFLKIPVQRAYLLPMLPFALLVVGIALQQRQRTLLAMTILILSYNFVSLRLARPDVPDHATRAIMGVYVEPGYLLEDIFARRDNAQAPIAPLPGP
jgi:hypothetical protein